MTNQKLSALKDQGLIKDYASASQFLISPQEQQLRLKNGKTTGQMKNNSKSVNSWKQLPPNIVFRSRVSFDSFYQWMNQPFGEYHYTAQGDDLSGKLLNEWQTSARFHHHAYQPDTD